MEGGNGGRGDGSGKVWQIKKRKERKGKKKVSTCGEKTKKHERNPVIWRGVTHGAVDLVEHHAN